MILFVADQFADAHRDPDHAYPGGAELTDAAVIEAAPRPIVIRTFSSLSDADIDAASMIIVGNASRATSGQVARLSIHPRLVTFEHDLRICHHRGDMTRERHWLHNHAEWCTCRSPVPLSLMRAARGVIFLTNYQHGFYRRNPWYPNRPFRILGSSVFDAATIAMWRGVDRDVARTNEVAVSYSRHKAKGFEESIQRARSIAADPYVIRNLAPAAVLDVLGRTRRFIHMPRSPEWAGRLPVEARFMGCDVITNKRVGVTQESWWMQPTSIALDHVAGAAARFWHLVEELLH